MTTTATPPSPDVLELDAGVIEEARTRQRHHRAAGAALLLVAAVAALSAYLAAGGGGSTTHSTAPVSEDSAASARSVTVRLPRGRTTATFTIAAPAGQAYDVSVAAPAAAAVTLTMQEGIGTGWSLDSLHSQGCHTSVGQATCVLHFAAGGNPGGTWTAVVRKASIPAARVRVRVVFHGHAGVFAG